eukprot:CAMPEP_0182595608 /NCGR_PEP_ID=MMETSP1324-20130603/82612_1 /TAXON_ID=236786 /ORGANISM="Florenciella sp., Strain RCC1587" /LENGTH=34 /DNA_ID= /DNA_START= /DNA_END= /DNA_ORIENTATION=
MSSELVSPACFSCTLSSAAFLGALVADDLSGTAV